LGVTWARSPRLSYRMGHYVNRPRRSQ
jgi:hypothetical protein